MHAPSRSDRPVPVIAGNYLRHPAGNDFGRRAMVTCVLIALPNPAPSLMAASPQTGKITGDRPRWNPPRRDHSAIWLRNAAAGLCVLATAAAVVSFTAQYRLVYATRRLAVVAGLEAAIPDAAALVFACLGIALALHGRRAIRARILNLASVGTSVFMNTIAAAPGWRNLAVWAMPPVAYALASDTLIGVVRAAAIARHHDLDAAMAPEEKTPLAVAGGLVLWLLRLALAPVSTLAGFRTWVVGECPVVPGPRVRAGRSAVPGRGRGEGDQDGPVPVLGDRTARVSRLDSARCRRRDRRHPRAPRRVERWFRPRGAAQGRPGRPERRPPMIIKLAILLAVVLIVAGFASWAFLPARYLPGNRARHLRIRLHLRLHPGKGLAKSSACGCAGAASRSCAGPARSVPPCPGGTACWTRASTRCSSAAPSTGTGCGSRWRSTCWSWRLHGPIRRRSWPT